MSRKILIIGRSGSGKDKLATCLTKYFGRKQLISVTTRPKRCENDAHIFVTEEEAATMTDRIAETVINDYQYFATQGQLDECDIYVVDPKGAHDVCVNSPDTDLCIVYVNASKKVRRQRAIDRADDKEEAARIFEERHADENKMFTEFENLIYYENPEAFHNAYPTASVIITLDNEKNNIEKMIEKAELVDMYTNQMDLGETFGPYVHRI